MYILLALSNENHTPGVPHYQIALSQFHRALALAGCDFPSRVLKRNLMLHDQMLAKPSRRRAKYEHHENDRIFNDFITYCVSLLKLKKHWKLPAPADQTLAALVQLPCLHQPREQTGKIGDFQDFQGFPLRLNSLTLQLVLLKQRRKAQSAETFFCDGYCTHKITKPPSITCLSGPCTASPNGTRLTLRERHTTALNKAGYHSIRCCWTARHVFYAFFWAFLTVGATSEANLKMKG